MLVRVKQFALPICIALSICFALLIVHSSETFHDCIERSQYKAAQESFPKKVSPIPVTFFMVKGCWGDYADKNANAIVALFTVLLAGSTIGLWSVTKKSADAALRQANITAAVEAPIPLISAFKLVQYETLPSEVSIVDPVPGGSIPANCRILFIIENKGRTVLRCIDLCLEKFIGQSLPEAPIYENIQAWGVHLEKGPIWIRPFDAQAAVTPADIGAWLAVSPKGAFWVYGYISYLSLLGETLQYKFLWRWDLDRGFIQENRPTYT